MIYLHTIWIFLTFSGILIIQSRYIDGDICDENEEYNTCGTQCPRTCADVNKLAKPCSHLCHTGCFCIEGYVRKHDDNSECIKETQC